MRLVMNGEVRDVAPQTTVAELVWSHGVQAERGVAVAVDGEVVPRSEWAETVVGEGQRVEVLRAVQGG
jgi:sulfur carrier protein